MLWQNSRRFSLNTARTFQSTTWRMPCGYARCSTGWRRRAEELLDKVGLKDRLHHLPAELSGGEMQRVALARALVTDPALVLADEPTGNLDAMTGSEILKMLAELSLGSSTSLVMVTHSPDAAAICNRVLTLENGLLA